MITPINLINTLTTLRASLPLHVLQSFQRLLQRLIFRTRLSFMFRCFTRNTSPLPTLRASRPLLIESSRWYERAAVLPRAVHTFLRIPFDALFLVTLPRVAVENAASDGEGDSMAAFWRVVGFLFGCEGKYVCSAGAAV